MRPFEFIFFSALTLTLIIIIIPWSKRNLWLRLASALPIIALLIQVLAEGYRWQLLPAYVVSGIVFLIGMPTMIQGQRTTAKARWLLKILTFIGSLAGLAILWISVELCIQLPSFTMPVPNGPYLVGTRTLLLVDETRIDSDSPLQNGFRSMSIQAWYPADLSGNEERTRYLSKAISAEMEQLIGMPAWFNAPLELIKTYAYWEARIAQVEEQFPVILYSPSGNASLHKILFEELASQGYVVVSISHPHWSNVLLDDHGQVIPQGGVGERYQAWFREADLPAVRSAQERINYEENIQIVEQAQMDLNNARPIAISELRQWSEDVSFVIDQLTEMNQPGGYFDNQMDLSRLGVMGFSLGGATAGQFCATDKRCGAGINVDGFMFGDILDHNLAVPFMFIHSTYPGVGSLFYEWSENNAYIMQIAGVIHHDLGAPAPTGKPILFPMEMNPGQFPDGAYLARIMNDYILNFFDKHLKNQPSPLLDGSSPYPEVLFMNKDVN